MHWLLTTEYFSIFKSLIEIGNTVYSLKLFISVENISYFSLRIYTFWNANFIPHKNSHYAKLSIPATYKSRFLGITNVTAYFYRVFQGRLYNFNVPFSLQIEQVDQVSRAVIDH